MSDGAVQAEPFEETLERFRLRVIKHGGSTEEHYALRKIDQLHARVTELEEQIENRRQEDIEMKTRDY